MPRKVRFGLLVRTYDGHDVVWGPRAHKSTFFDAGSWKFFQERFRPYGEPIAIVELVNWTELSSRIAECEAYDERGD
ncbi:hypothetical protein [Amycolatopsis sp. CA-230715]|uniref:hypothetical protein n=1 Tax=Amycolatopsis sp. CA-230715 TaxID=2745196 RepID=UPI001C025ACC|nr:hypothetical protein [Amycolatopsis sp. CA-230715]QWF85712.1 hypothetical protein HUW46_09192 [Amycolatopsis sp. CA-230715]